MTKNQNSRGSLELIRKCILTASENWKWNTPVCAAFAQLIIQFSFSLQIKTATCSWVKALGYCIYDVFYNLWGRKLHYSLILLAIRHIKAPIFAVNFTFSWTIPKSMWWIITVQSLYSCWLVQCTLHYMAAQEQSNTSPIDRLEITTQTFRH